MVYLAGPGRANEHENPQVVAGHDTALATVEEGAKLTRDDALALGRTLDQPRVMFGRSITKPIRRWDKEQGKRVKVGETDAHVWHCSLSLSAGADEPLTDAAWKMIAEQFVERMGFIDPDRAKTSRWVAVRHGLSKNGNDHIHIAVQMVTEDGSRAREHNDRSRSQQVCRELEREFGLAVTEGAAMKQTLPHEKAWERQRTERERSPFIERKELRRRLRAAAAGATSEAEFVQRVYSSGVILRPRFATGRTDQVTGYSVALPPPSGVDRAPVFYSPAKHLDKNLSLPKVRAALGVPREGDPRAVGAWQEHHSATRDSAPKQTLAPPAEALRNRLAAGSVSVADLSASMRPHPSTSSGPNTDHWPKPANRSRRGDEPHAGRPLRPPHGSRTEPQRHRRMDRTAAAGDETVRSDEPHPVRRRSRAVVRRTRPCADEAARHTSTTATATLERPPAAAASRTVDTDDHTRATVRHHPEHVGTTTTRTDQPARDTSRTRDDGVER